MDICLCLLSALLAAAAVVFALVVSAHGVAVVVMQEGMEKEKEKKKPTQVHGGLRAKRGDLAAFPPLMHLVPLSAPQYPTALSLFLSFSQSALDPHRHHPHHTTLTYHIELV